jgi:hypothetical protein
MWQIFASYNSLRSFYCSTGIKQVCLGSICVITYTVNLSLFNRLVNKDLELFIHQHYRVFR